MWSALSVACKSTAKENIEHADATPDEHTPEKHPAVDLMPNQILTAPATITIDSKGIWYAFEGELGTVDIYDRHNKKLETAIIRSKDGDWMKEGSSKFIATLNFHVDETQEGKLVFNNNVVSDRDKNRSFEIPVTLDANQAGKPSGRQLGGTYCFAAKTPAHNKKGAYNYHFVRLMLSLDHGVRGYFHSSPYGTDGSRGSIRGVYNETEGKLIAEEQKLAEGELYVGQVNYHLAENELGLGYKDAHGKEATLPGLTCEAYDALFREYQQRNMRWSTNTTDRSRLKKVKAFKEMGLSDAALDKIRFMEAPLDLDNDPVTTEYLLYVMDPLVCGTGGCNLFLLNDKSEVLSAVSVVRPPVYTTVSSFEEVRVNKGKWKDLYVFSKGMRRLSPDEHGKYPGNASAAPRILEEQLLAFPQQYRLVMEYLPDN